MYEFLKSPNFIRLVYLAVAIALVVVGFVNKDDLMRLYLATVQACG
jgi:hypothetical protein